MFKSLNSYDWFVHVHVCIIVCSSGFVSRVKLLLRFKADCTIANAKNELPIHRAASSDKNIEVERGRERRERESGGGRERSYEV